MKTRTVDKFLSVIAVLLACAVVAACNRGTNEAATPAATTSVVKPKQSKAAQNPLANMIKAVPVAAGEQPVELRFELAARPEVGQAVEVKLNLLGLADASDMHLTITAAPGLDVLSGAQANFTSLKVGESLSHQLSVRSKDAGIFIADVQLMATINGAMQTLNYSIPVAIVTPDAPAAAATAPTGMAAGG